MKAAITVWDKRISPVFDVARNFIVLDIENNRIKQKTLETFSSDYPERKASRMKELSVDILICGAISKYFARVFSVHHIEVIPFITGDSDVVIQAFLAGKLPNPRLMMPGCCKWLKNFREK